MIIRRIGAFLLFIFILSGMVSCQKNEVMVLEDNSFAMGTIITQNVYGENTRDVLSKVNERMKSIENTMTINAPGGDINTVNGAAGNGKFVDIGEDTAEVLRAAKKYATLTEGSFDPTVGPLVKAWGVYTKNPRVPAKKEIDQLLGLVSYQDIVFEEGNASAVRLEEQGQMVDVGGIAKGYAGDEAIRIYKESGVSSAYISLGGNIVVLGTKPDGQRWNVGVQNPRAQNGRYIGILSLKDKAVVTSGDYERFFEEGNHRYHHIIDPQTGYPSDSGLISSTIVADRSMDADALSTATFVLGLEKGMDLVETLEGVEGVFITSEKKVFVTSGLKDTFKFDDESKEFEYVQKR